MSYKYYKLDSTRLYTHDFFKSNFSILWVSFYPSAEFSQFSRLQIGNAFRLSHSHLRSTAEPGSGRGMSPSAPKPYKEMVL